MPMTKRKIQKLLIESWKTNDELHEAFVKLIEYDIDLNERMRGLEAENKELKRLRDKPFLDEVKELNEEILADIKKLRIERGVK